MVGGADVLVGIKRANMAAAPAPAPSGVTSFPFSHPSAEMNSVPSDLSVKLPGSTVMRFGTEPDRFSHTGGDPGGSFRWNAAVSGRSRN